MTLPAAGVRLAESSKKLPLFMELRTINDFLHFSTGLHASGSKAPPSYVTAIEKTNEALRRHGVFLSPGESIWTIRDRARLKELYELVKREQAKGERGIFSEEKSPSYWRNSFCSAAIKDFIKYVDFIRVYDVANADAHTAKSLTSALEHIQKGMQGTDAVRQTKVRVNQYLFRKMVLDNYRHRCCVTGLSIPEVLRASHITPWAEDKENRLDPENGLCLSATFDAAFDRHLISFDEDLRLIFAPSLRKYYGEESFERLFVPYEGKQIEAAAKFKPAQKFLRLHRKNMV